MRIIRLQCDICGTIEDNPMGWIYFSPSGYMLNKLAPNVDSGLDLCLKCLPERFKRAAPQSEV